MLIATQAEGQRHVRYVSRCRLAIVWLAILVLGAGCNLREDATLYISNHSGASWYLAVDSRDNMHFVTRVADGAEGAALVWESHGDRTVSVLDKSCSVVGTLQVQPDGSYALPAIPGLTATIEAHRTTGSYAEGIEATSDCGGEGYM